MGHGISTHTHHTHTHARVRHRTTTAHPPPPRVSQRKARGFVLRLLVLVCGWLAGASADTGKVEVTYKLKAADGVVSWSFSCAPAAPRHKTGARGARFCHAAVPCCCGGLDDASTQWRRRSGTIRMAGLQDAALWVAASVGTLPRPTAEGPDREAPRVASSPLLLSARP